MRKIGIGLNWQGAFNMQDAIEQAKVADDSGVDHLMVAEAWGRDAFTTMAILGYETHNIRIGTAIINVFSRTPAALAQHFTSLDALTDGRMIIGIGSSGPQVIEHFHGMPFDKPMRRIREYTEIINMLVAGEPLNYHGKIFNLERGFTLRHLDELPRRHIPIFIGHGGSDSLIPWMTPQLFFEQVKKGMPSYPIRFDLFVDGAHGTPLRLTDWRRVLNWMLPQAGETGGAVMVVPSAADVPTPVASPRR